ncbi:MAG: Lrp/AsnC ligand binding domain-containing protein [Promethearchaeota archaeon]|jgi:DNA-binding Lrp family transcriptional regulator
MAIAFVMITSEIGAEDKILKGLKAIPEVKEAHVVYGVYDIILRVEAETMNKLKDVISWKIRRFEGVRSTITMIVLE